jgi:hypothetical protein
MDRSEPLRAALAWRIADGDEDVVTWVGNHTEFSDPSILVRGLRHKMKEAGCVVPLQQPYGQLALAERYSGRLQRLAERFEVDRCADSNNGILCLDRYLLRCVNDAVREICQAIRDGKLSAEGLAMVDGVERGIERLPPDVITETMTLRKDGALCTGLNTGGRCWKSVCVSRAGFLKCFPPAKPTIRAQKDCVRWLQSLMETSPNRRLREKSDFFLEARARYPGLSERAFGRAWSIAARAAGAEAWTKGGRPRKSPQ